MAFLEFDGICKSYGDLVAVRDVSFEVYEGEIFGLLGPNGAGKTTLIRLLMDILRADDGRITLFGEPHRRNALDLVGYLPEERGLYNKHKVIDVMTYFGALKGFPRAEARRRALDWLNRMGLAETADWRVERLSKGMSQKVQIASALMAEPRLAVLDEPFSGLDPINVRMVKQLILERRRAGGTTILSTHQMNMVEELCNRVALVHRGSLLVYGPVSEVRTQYSLPEVRVEVDGELPELPGVARRVTEGDAAWRLLLEESTDPQAVLRALVDAGLRVDRFERVLAPMEDVFVSVVQQETSA